MPKAKGKKTNDSVVSTVGLQLCGTVFDSQTGFSSMFLIMTVYFMLL